MGQAACDTEQEVWDSSCCYVVDQPKPDYTTWEDKPLLYISGPMTSESNPYTNITRAMEAAYYARARGWSVIIPHLDCLFAMWSAVDSANFYLDNDLNLLDRCDAMLVLPYIVEYKTVDGDLQQTRTSVVLDFAKDRHIPIFTMQTLPLGTDFEKEYL